MTSQEILRIKSVTIKNFRGYYLDSGPILFSRDQESPLTIYHGTNALGKTSLFNAIHWGIYGKEKQSIDHKAKSEGIVNSYIIDTLEVGINNEMFVKIQLENQNSELQYEIQRKIILSKEGVGKELVINDLLEGKIPRSIGATSEVTFSYKDPDSADGELIKTSNQFTVNSLLKKIFPRDLSSFFLLDGELLDEFLNGNGPFIKTGIEQISQLPLLQNCKKHIQFTSNKVGSNATTNKTQYILKSEVLEKKRKTKENFEGAMPKIEADIIENQNKLDAGIKMVQKNDEETVRLKQNTIESGKASLKIIDMHLKKHKSDIKDLVYQNLDKILMKNGYLSTAKKYEKYIEEKKLPSKFSKDILEQLLQSHECICGRKLEQDQSATNAIKEMLDVSYDSTLGNSLNKIVEQTNDIISEFKKNTSLLDDIKKLHDEISEYRIEFNNIKNQNELLEKELDKMNIKELEEIRKSNDKLKITITDLTNEKYGKTTIIDGLSKEITNLEAEFMKLTRLTIKDDHALHKMDLGNYIKNILDKAHEQLRKDFVAQVRSATEELFLKTAPQAHEFHSVSIDERTFAISANRAPGADKMISRGQAHVLGISFINAIRRITTINYFMMIDSPFHNISQQERIHICNQLPISHKNTQLTLFVTDGEYEADIKKSQLSSVRTALNENNLIGCEYNLIKEKIAKIKDQDYFRSYVEKYK